MTTQLIRVRLPSGNDAIYQVTPNHLPRPDIPDSAHWPAHCGTQIAHEQHGQWFRVGNWQPVTDPKTLQMIAGLA
jgi:hypothetical protein